MIMVREKLIELLGQVSCSHAACDGDCGCCRNVEMFDDDIEYIADYLLSNGVVVIDTDVVSPENRPLITHIAGIPFDEIINTYITCIRNATQGKREMNNEMPV